MTRLIAIKRITDPPTTIHPPQTESVNAESYQVAAVTAFSVS